MDTLRGTGSVRRNLHRIVLSLVIGFFALSAYAAPGDDIASQIEKLLEDARLQTDVQPEQALIKATEARRLLEQLQEVSPDYQDLPRLEKEVGALEGKLATPEAAAVAASPPRSVAQQLEGMRARLRDAEGAMLSGDVPRAKNIVAEVETALEKLRTTRQAEIPQGHVPLFVLEERIAALKQQLSEADAGSG